MGCAGGDAGPDFLPTIRRNSCLSWSTCPRWSLLAFIICAPADLRRRPRRILGRTLASLHHATSATPVLAEARASLAAPVPWILRAYRQTPAALGVPPGAGTQLLALLQHYPEFGPLLATLHASWEQACLIHGDLKWENCLYSPTVSDNGVALRLVDWEFAGLGDPAWDVGAALQSYLAWWALTVDAAPPNPVYLLAPMQPAIRAFWQAYADTRGLGAPVAAAFLGRCVAFAGARLIQTAYESLYQTAVLNRAAVRALQIALNILQAPEAATHILLTL